MTNRIASVIENINCYGLCVHKLSDKNIDNIETPINVNEYNYVQITTSIIRLVTMFSYNKHRNLPVSFMGSVAFQQCWTDRLPISYL